MENADVIVLASDRPDVAFVAEVKMRVGDLAQVEHQLKSYMLDRRCPIALLVTPQIARIYRDTFEDFTEDSIVLAEKHVFVESNWVFDFCSPQHRRKPEAERLLDRADAGDCSTSRESAFARGPSPCEGNVSHALATWRSTGAWPTK